MKLIWAFPAMQGKYRSKPHSYLGHLLGHEGKHSVFAVLKKYGLALGISAGLRTNAKQFSLFSVTVLLTEKGVERVETVLEVFFAYVCMLKATGPQNWVFEELKLISDLEFRYKSKENAMQYVHVLASSMQKHPPKDVISALNLVIDYSPEEISELVELLTPKNAIVFLIGKNNSDESWETEKWYVPEYKITKMTEELTEKLTNSSFSDPEIRLDYPPKNHFLPTEFNILAETAGKEPKLIADLSGFSVRHVCDTSFKKDFVQSLVYIKCGDVGYWATPLGYVLAKIWVKLFIDSVKETTYMASQAGFSIDISTETLGIVITVSGFSQHFGEFITEIAEKLANFQVKAGNDQKFEENFAEIARNLKNTKLQQPHIQAKTYFSDVISANLSVSNAAQINVLPLISFPDLVYFSQKWLKNLRFDWLLVGNISENDAFSIANKSCAYFFEKNRTFPINETEIPSKLAFSLKIDENRSHFVFETDLEDGTNSNSAVFSYWECGFETLKLKSTLLIIENMLKEPCFSYLRTKMQLGYIVFQGNQCNRGIIGHYISVQSQRFAPVKLTECIDAFLSEMKQKMENLSEEEFLTHKNSAISAILQKDVSLEKRFQRFQTEMLLSRYDFSRREKIGEILQEITKIDVQNAFISLFFEKTHRIDIEIVSKSKKDDQNSANFPSKRLKFDTIREMQLRLPIHPANPLIFA